MRLRTAFRSWLVPAAIVLPVWLLVGYGIFGDTLWMFPLVVVLAIGSAIALLGVAAIAKARPTVKRTGALSWADVALFTAWWLTIVVAGLAGPYTGALTVLAVLFALATFWLVLAELFADAKRSVKQTFDEFERQARTSSPLGFRPAPAPAAPVAEARDDGEYIVVREQHGA